MHNSSCSGHVVRLTELYKIINPYAVPTIENTLADANEEEITGLINYLLPDGFPKVESVFILTPDDESEELERDTWYACFSLEELFIQTPTPGLLALQAKDINPERKNWVIFG